MLSHRVLCQTSSFAQRPSYKAATSPWHETIGGSVMSPFVLSAANNLCLPSVGFHGKGSVWVIEPFSSKQKRPPLKTTTVFLFFYLH